jgi:FHS family L-fucose permease-like MFS transporter
MNASLQKDSSQKDASQKESGQKNNQTSTLIPMIIIGTLFFVFGFVTWLNGSLIPFLKIVCDLNDFQAFFVTFAFYIAYTFMALPASFVLRKIGFKTGMVVGLGVMALGALLFIPAAKSTTYFLFLTALFVLGAGLTLLQTASNPYIVCIGPRESAAMRISIMGLINKSAGVLVPLLFTAWILTGMDQFSTDALASLDAGARAERLADLSSRLVTPYLIMAVVLIALMAFVHFSPLAELDLNDEKTETEQNKLGVLQFPQLILGTIALFLYVGVEVIAGDTIGLYGRNLGVTNFGSLTSYTMGFMVAGYIVGVTCIPKYLSQANALLLSAVAGLLFVAGVLFSSNADTGISHALLAWAGVPAVPNSVFFLASLGFANALVWPAIWPLALQGLGKYTSTGSALLIMAIAGGALLPLVYGQVAHSTGNSQLAYWVMVPCYAFILFYALKGHKLKSWK